MGRFLYHANNAATITKTTLDGTIVWRSDMTLAWSKNSEHWPFKPTDSVIHPDHPDVVLVADGYGLSKVHAFEPGPAGFDKAGSLQGGAGRGVPLCDHPKGARGCNATPL